MVPGEQLRIVIEQRDAAEAERDLWQARAMALFWQGVVDDATVAEIRKATDECSAWLESRKIARAALRPEGGSHGPAGVNGTEERK